VASLYTSFHALIWDFVVQYCFHDLIFSPLIAVCYSFLALIYWFLLFLLMPRRLLFLSIFFSEHLSSSSLSLWRPSTMGLHYHLLWGCASVLLHVSLHVVCINSSNLSVNCELSYACVSFKPSTYFFVYVPFLLFFVSYLKCFGNYVVKLPAELCLLMFLYDVT